jgi:hypothetical protein
MMSAVSKVRLRDRNLLETEIDMLGRIKAKCRAPSVAKQVRTLATTSMLITAAWSSPDPTN